jgi:hypothetical protein
MPTIHLHSRQLLMIARETAVRARATAASPGALTADAILAIVMSAASTEAFVNEFAEYAPGVYSSFEAPPALTTCVQVLRELEESRVPVTTKYLIATQVLDGKGFNTGAPPYQDFKLLIDLRNAIMHIKVALEGERHSGQRIAEALGQRSLAVANTGPGSFSWFDRVQTAAVAVWAHDSALEVIRSFLGLVPARPHYDPLEDYRRSFRDHPPIP